MRAECDGVAGFFEDLPVLMFVLAGVASLVLTSVFASERIASATRADELEAIADRAVASVCSEMLTARGPDAPPSLASIRSMNCSELMRQAVEGRDFALSIVCLHPSLGRVLHLSSNGTDMPGQTGYASELVNALADDGLVVVVDVRVIVW